MSTFALKSFNDNFVDDVILDDALKSEHQKALDTFLDSLK